MYMFRSDNVNWPRTELNNIKTLLQTSGLWLLNSDTWPNGYLEEKCCVLKHIFTDFFTLLSVNYQAFFGSIMK